MAQRRRSDLGRRLAGPGIILLVAAGIAFFVWERQKAQTAEVQVFVETLCRRVVLEDGAAWSLSGSDPAVTRSLTSVMKEMFAELDSGAWAVEVVAGDVAPMADGTATHTATIIVHDEPMLGIRLVYASGSDDPDLATGPSITVLGYWLE